jgi:hypothetical protein
MNTAWSPKHLFLANLTPFSLERVEGHIYKLFVTAISVAFNLYVLGPIFAALSESQVPKNAPFTFIMSVRAQLENH